MAKKSVWDLCLNMQGDNKHVKNSIRTVQKQIQDLQSATKRLGSDFKNFADNAAKLAVGVGAGIGAATAGVVTLANSFAEVGDKAAKTSAQLGIGVEAYQELSYAMSRSGVSAEEFDGALQKMVTTARQGAAGNEAMRKKLLDIGISAEKLANKKPEEAISIIADGMQKLSSDAERTNAAIALFGKSAGPKMVAAMAQGSDGLKALGQEAHRLGLIISSESAKQSENYLDTQADLVDSIRGMKNQFISGAIAPLTQAFAYLKEAMVDNLPAIQELGAKFGQWLGTMVQKLPEIIAKIKEFAANVWDNVNKVKDFLGGWKNVAKLVAALAIAPTFIAGIKTVISLATVIKTLITGIKISMVALKASSVAAGAAAAAGGAAGATGFGAMAAAVFAATWPILAIIAAIALVTAGVIAFIKNFDKIKEVAGKAWEGIKNVFGAVGGFFKNVWNGVKEGATKAWDKTKETAGKAWEGIKGAASKAGGFLKNNWKSVAIGMVNPMAGGLKMLYDNNEKFRNAVDKCFGAIKNIAGKVWDLMPEGLQNVCLKVKDIFMGLVEKIKGIWNGIKEFFTGLWGAFKEGPAAVVEYIKTAFFGLFDSIKDKFLGFINVIKDGWDKVKGVFGKVTGGVKNLFGSGNKMQGHAEGGIFTTRHIAEICEKGAEAVVPLDKSARGYEIWKQAGEVGGYAQREYAPVSTPTMEAASQYYSANNSPSISADFNITINCTGGSDVVTQISEAGNKLGEQLKDQFNSLIESYMRDKMRVAYA